MQRNVAEGSFYPHGCRNKEEEVVSPQPRAHRPRCRGRLAASRTTAEGLPPGAVPEHGVPAAGAGTSLMGSTDGNAGLPRGHCVASVGTTERAPSSIVGSRKSPCCNAAPVKGHQSIEVSITICWKDTSSTQKQHKFVLSPAHFPISSQCSLVGPNQTAAGKSPGNGDFFACSPSRMCSQN